MSNNKTSVFISGSDFLIQKGISALVSSLPNFHIVDMNSQPLYDQVKAAPDGIHLLIHEFEKGSKSLYEQLESILSNTTTKVLLIIGTIEKESVQKLIKIGVKGIVTKQCSKEEIINAISTTLKGELFLCSKVLKVILSEENSIRNQGQVEIALLTKRELEVLPLITKGHTTMTIADILNVSVHTINSHRKNILKKLNLKSPIELIVYAIENNLVDKN